MKSMAEATVSSDYRIVIPRDALDLKPGDKLIISTIGEKIIIMKRPESYQLAIRGLGRGLYPKDYLRKERDSWR
jgi:AbrB family looped-hinge helix DNA binding protein